MSSITRLWRVYCITENTMHQVFSTTEPTECPINAGHTINSDFTAILDHYVQNPNDVNVLQALREEFGTTVTTTYSPVKGKLITSDNTGPTILDIGSDNYILTADSSEDSGLKWDLLLNNPDTFGALFQSVVDNSESSTTSTSFVEKIKLTTTNLVAGEYIIMFRYDWRVDNSSFLFYSQVELDDTTVINSFSGSEPEYRAETSFVIQTLTSGVHTIDIDFRSESPSKTVYIRVADIVLWRVG